MYNLIPAIFCLLPCISFAAPDITAPGSWSFTWENDLFSPKKQDRHYTNGMQIKKMFEGASKFDQSNTFTWISSLANHLPLTGNKWQSHSTSLGFGQIIQTPADLTTETPDPNDTPYGGILYLSHGLDSFDNYKADSFNLMVGITGKYSLAGQTQKLIHRLTGSEPPKGWDEQIPTELLLNAYYSRRSYLPLTSEQENWQLDAVGHGQLAFGNADTHALASIGLSLHQSSISSLLFVPGRLSRGMIIVENDQSQGWYFYSGVSAKAVVWDVLLDGTLFRDSPSVEKKPLVGQFTSHFGYKWRSISTHYTWVISSHTYEHERDGLDQYGSLNISWRL